MAVPTLSITRDRADDGRRRAAGARGATRAPTARAWRPTTRPSHPSTPRWRAIGATGAADEVRRLPAPGDGAADRAHRPRRRAGHRRRAAARRRLRRAAADRDRAARRSPCRSTSAADVAAVLEGAGIGAYAYTGYRVGSLGTTKTPADDIVVHLPDDVDADVTALVARATAVVTAVHTVRDLVNTPPSDLYPETLAAAAVDLAQGLPVDVEVLDEAQLARGRLRRHPRRRLRVAARPADGRACATPRPGRRSTSPSSARASRSTPAACR